MNGGLGDAGRTRWEKLCERCCCVVVMHLHGYRSICSPLNKSGLGFCFLFLRSPVLGRPWSLLVVLKAQVRSVIYTNTNSYSTTNRFCQDNHRKMIFSRCISRWVDCIFVGRPSWADLWEASLSPLLPRCPLPTASSGCRIYRDHGKNFKQTKRGDLNVQVDLFTYPIAAASVFCTGFQDRVTVLL